MILYIFITPHLCHLFIFNLAYEFSYSVMLSIPVQPQYAGGHEVVWFLYHTVHGQKSSFISINTCCPLNKPPSFLHKYGGKNGIF